jgi:hypothetical protein
MVCYFVLPASCVDRAAVPMLSFGAVLPSLPLPGTGNA